MLIAARVVISVLALALVVAVAVTVARRRALARDADLVVCAMRDPGGAHVRPGILRLTRAELEWYTRFGVTARAAYRWPRRGVDLGPPLSLGAEARTGLGHVPAVQVDLTARSSRGGAEQRAQLVLPGCAYTAVRAWAEAAPPAHLPFDY